jgi:Putative rhamnosyl transferase
MLKHFVVTRLGLGVYSERRIADVVSLFEAVTLPSLAGQTSQDFLWLVVVDADMPAAASRQVERMLQPYSNFHLVTLDVTELTHVRHGCFDWVWDRCQDYILETSLLRDPPQYIITSVIDADDAWHHDVIRAVNTCMSAQLPQVQIGEESRGTWLRHSAGVAATFRHGYKWFIDADVWEPFDCPFMSMSVFVVARFSSGISACSSRHLGWPSFCKVLAFEMLEIAQDEPMWVYARHDRATQPWSVSSMSTAETAGSLDRCRVFGIDRNKLRQRQGVTAHGATAASLKSYSGRNASDQYDRIFKIAALNRKIAALSRRNELGELAAAEGERSRLIGMLRTCGEMDV